MEIHYALFAIPQKVVVGMLIAILVEDIKKTSLILLPRLVPVEVKVIIKFHLLHFHFSTLFHSPKELLLPSLTFTGDLSTNAEIG